MLNSLFLALQYIVPQQLLSRFAGRLAESRNPGLKNALIKLFIARFKVDLNEALISNIHDFENFNDFFCRALKPGVRPLEADERAIVSPADGCISQLGPIKSGRIFQAKGQDYSVTELIGDAELAAQFQNGQFMTVYLSPRDYHRVHMPQKAALQHMRYIPGRLFSVNEASAAGIPALFARNERLVCVFDIDGRPMVMVLVGAMIVAGIETVWAGHVGPQAGRESTETCYEQSIVLERGEEMGRFKLGSTVILLYPEGHSQWLANLQAGSKVKVRSKIGSWIN